MEKYMLMDLITTKKGNHALKLEGEGLVLDKMGNRIEPIFQKKEIELFASKAGNFIIKRKNNIVFIFQIVKVIREIEEDFKGITKIQNIPAEALKYKALVYYINKYDAVNKTWDMPLINRIKEEVNYFVTNR